MSMDAIVYENLSAEQLTEEGCFVLQNWGLPADGSLSVARARVVAGGSTRWHRLSGVRELYLVTAGRGRVELGGRGPAEVAPGDLVNIPAGTAQRITNPGSVDLIFYCICTPAFTPACYSDMEGAGAEKEES